MRFVLIVSLYFRCVTLIVTNFWAANEGACKKNCNDIFHPPWNSLIFIGIFHSLYIRNPCTKLLKRKEEEREVSTQRKRVFNLHISWRRCKNIGNSGTNLLFLRIRTKFIPTALGFMLKYRTCNTHSHLHFSWVTTTDCFCTSKPL